MTAAEPKPNAMISTITPTAIPRPVESKHLIATTIPLKTIKRKNKLGNKMKYFFLKRFKFWTFLLIVLVFKQLFTTYTKYGFLYMLFFSVPIFSFRFFFFFFDNGHRFVSKLKRVRSVIYFYNKELGRFYYYHYNEEKTSPLVTSYKSKIHKS